MQVIILPFQYVENKTNNQRKNSIFVLIQYSFMTIYILGNISQEGLREKLLLKAFFCLYHISQIHLQLVYA